MVNEVQDDFLAAIQESDRLRAIEIAKEWADLHGYDAVFPEVIDPVLQRIGRDYENGVSVSMAYGYIAAKVCEEILNLAVKKLGEVTVVQRGTVVLGNIEDDFHALGRRMVGVFLSTAGWKVIDLGNDVPAANFVTAAKEHDALVIGVSAMMQTTALGIAAVRTELNQQGLSGRVKLAVGGAIFALRPDLVQQVGGDGTARNAFQAPKLIASLADAARQYRGVA